MPETVYVARFSYGQASLVKFGVKKETTKKYWLGDMGEVLYGRCVYTKRTADKFGNVRERAFVEETEAWNWLYEKAQLHYKNKLIEAARAEEQRNTLRNFWDEATLSWLAEQSEAQ